MSFSIEQIESIVQSVISELATHGVDVRAHGKPLRAAVPTCDDTPQGQSAPAEIGDVLVVTGKVITEESLAGAGAAGRPVQLQKGAIVTPSGHDFIRRNSVTLAGTVSQAATVIATGLVISQNCHAAVSAAETANWGVETAGCPRIAARIARQSRNQRIICCVDVPSVTACLLNRQSDTRAAVLESPDSAQRLLDAMNPDVLCLTSTQWSFTGLLRLMRQVSQRSLAPPTDWEEA